MAGLWDDVTKASVVAVAVIEAINETLKLEPELFPKLPGIVFHVMHFLPLVLLTVAGLVQARKAIGLHGSKKLAKLTEDIQRQDIERIPISQPHGETSIPWLMILYRTLTKVQANQVFELYRGQQVTLTGNVENVSEPPYNPPSTTVYLRLEDSKKSDDRLLAKLRFQVSWAARVIRLNRGERITARGKLDFVADYEVELQDCELLSAGPQQQAS